MTALVFEQLGPECYISRIILTLPWWCIFIHVDLEEFHLAIKASCCQGRSIRGEGTVHDWLELVQQKDRVWRKSKNSIKSSIWG